MYGLSRHLRLAIGGVAGSFASAVETDDNITDGAVEAGSAQQGIRLIDSTEAGERSRTEANPLKTRCTFVHVWCTSV